MGAQSFDAGIGVTLAIVLRGSAREVEAFLAELKERPRPHVVYVKTSIGPLKIVPGAEP